MKKLKVNEIFYSIQGEGARAGEASIFIRLAGCNLSCDFCDTDHLEGKEMTPEEILREITQYPSRWIVWTGGEPCLQLDTDLIRYFLFHSYFNAIETNGSLKPPHGLDYIACSPKVEPEILHAVFKGFDVDEFRYPIQQSSEFPEIEELPKAKHYYLSPVLYPTPKWTGYEGAINALNINKVVKHVKLNPKWKLSIQIHKLINIK